MEPGATSTYERNHVGVKTGSGERAAGPDPRVETAAEFLQRCGVDASRREGDMADRLHLLYGLLERHTHRPEGSAGGATWVEAPRRVLEIGFNAATSALFFLHTFPSALVVSCDLVEHDYVHLAKMYVDARFPKRHVLLAGDSAATLSTFTALAPSAPPFDVVLIDGSHLESGVAADIAAVLPLCSPHSLVLLDDVAPHRGCGKGVYAALRAAVEAGELQVLEVAETDGFDNAVAACRPPPPTGRPAPPPADALWPRLERQVRAYELVAAVKRATSMDEVVRLSRQLDALGSDPAHEVPPWAPQLVSKRVAALIRDADRPARAHSKRRRR